MKKLSFLLLFTLSCLFNTCTYLNAEVYINGKSQDQVIEGTDVASTGETDSTKYLGADGDGTCSWRVPGGGGGVGDVSKVGTPVDDQIGVWTGDGTIEGTTAFTYDGTELAMTGNVFIRGTGEDVGIGKNALASNTGTRVSGVGESTAESNSGNYSNFTGYEAGKLNSGNYVNGYGETAVQSNTGNYVDIFGFKGGQKNVGDRIGGIGYEIFRYNSGDHVSGGGNEALWANTGNNANGYGNGALKWNDGDTNSAIGSEAFNSFPQDAGSAETWTTAIAGNRITVTGHSFGLSGTYINLNLTTTGVLPTGLAAGMHQWFVVGTNTLECRTDSFTAATGSGTHTLTPQYVYTNSTAIGYNAEPDASNQIMLGDANVTTVKTTGVIIPTGLTIGSAVVDETELEILDGATLTTAELNYSDNVTSDIQAQLDGKEGTLTNSAGLAAALSDETGTGLVVFGTNPTFSDNITATGNVIIGSAEVDETELEILDGATLTTTELNYSDNVTSDIQTQINGKEDNLVNSAGLAAALSDETGTGVSVFSIAPTFEGLACTGNISVTGTVDGIDIATDVAANTAKNTNVPTALSTGTVDATTYSITSDGGADDITLVEADTDNAGLLGADKWDEIVANTAKNTNVSTTLEAGTVTATTYGITSDGSADDIVLPEADTDNAGLLGADKWDEIVVNTAKVSNVSTALSTGTVNATTYSITSDGGADDITLVEADTDNAGLLGAAKWDEIVANTAKATNVSTTLAAGTVTATTYGITSDGGADDIVLPEADTDNAGLLGADKWDEIVANTAKTTNTDDQTIDVFSGSGDTISLSLESDGEATKTLDISSFTAIAANTAKTSFVPADVDSTTWSDGGQDSNIWTFDVSGTDTTMIPGNGTMGFSHAMTIGDTLACTGNAAFDNGSTGSGVIKILEDTDDGSNFASFEVPALAANTVYTLPTTDGTSGQVLQTDGDGVLSWTTNASGLSSSVSKTTDYNVTASDLVSNIIFDTNGAGGNVNFTLPAGASTYSAGFYVTGNVYVRNTANGSETFRYAENQSAGGGYVRSNTEGTFWRIRWFVDEWVITDLTNDLSYDE